MKLLRLSKPANINHDVQPVALPSSCVPSGTMCTTTGWGNTMSSTSDSGMFSQIHFQQYLELEVNKNYFGKLSKPGCKLWTYQFWRTRTA